MTICVVDILVGRQCVTINAPHKSILYPKTNQTLRSYSRAQTLITVPEITVGMIYYDATWADVHHIHLQRRHRGHAAQSPAVTFFRHLDASIFALSAKTVGHRFNEFRKGRERRRALQIPTAEELDYLMFWASRRTC